MSNLKANLDKAYKQHVLDVLREGINKRTEGLTNNRDMNPNRIDGIVEGMESVYEMIDSGLFVEDNEILTYARYGSKK